MGTVYSICIVLGCASQLQIGSNYPIYNSQPVISYVPGSKYSLVSQKKRRFSLINEVAVLFTTCKESPMKGCMTILLH